MRVGLWVTVGVGNLDINEFGFAYFASKKPDPHEMLFSLHLCTNKEMGGAALRCVNPAVVAPKRGPVQFDV